MCYFFPMPQVRITFWGVRGSIPAPGSMTKRFGGNTSCIEIVAGKERIICDAGTGIRALGIRLMRGNAKKPITAHILLSHLHWDHYMGLPFFAPLYGRRNRFIIEGPAAGQHGFGRALSRAMRPPYFPVPFSMIPAGIRFKTIGMRPFRVGKVLIEPFALHHPGGSLGWRFFFPNGTSLVHVTDNEPGSARYVRKLLRWIRGADVLIHDAQYTPGNYVRHRGWGHSPFTFPMHLASEAGIGRLFLFHFDPQDEDAQLERVRRKAKAMARELKHAVRVEMAREGMSFTL